MKSLDELPNLMKAEEINALALAKRREYSELLSPYEGMKRSSIPSNVIFRADCLLKEIVLLDNERGRLTLIEKVKELVQAIAEVLTPLIEYTIATFNKIWEAIATSFVPRKWWYLYKHAKRRRVRKKYEKRIREKVLTILDGYRDAKEGTHETTDE